MSRASTKTIVKMLEAADESPRQRILDEASNIVHQGRPTQYGEPEDNFSVIAGYWNAYLNGKGISTTLNHQDVALMMSLMKHARLTNNPNHRDSIVDIAGYAACMGGMLPPTDVKWEEQNDQTDKINELTRRASLSK